MARISDELINQIKQQVDLVRLVESQGYKLKSHGVKDKALSCPFHEDKTESCVITPAKNLFNCFGCGESGSVIDWVMKTQGVSFRHAVEILQKDTSFLAAPSSGHKPVKKATTQKLATPLATDADLQATLQQVIGYYHETLKQSPEALDYLKQRGLDHPELIDTFQLGYANRTLGYRLPQKNRQAGAEIRGKLQQIGILRKSGHEHFNGSIVIPVFDENGHVVEAYGRKLLDNLRKGTPKHTYLPEAHKGVWNASSLAASDEVILCESLIDAMTFWCAGFRNVTASYGTNGFTDDHLKAFKQCEIKRVLIAYDRDDAGHKAAEALAEKLMTEGFDVFRILFPKNMDANEYARQVKPAQKSLGLAIRKAEWWGKGKAPVISTTEQQPVVDVETGEILSPDVPSESATSLAASIPTEAAAIPEQALPEEVNPQNDKLVGNQFEHPKDGLKGGEHGRSESNELIVTLDDRRYRIRGLDKNQSYEQLKVNLLVSLDDRFHVDNLDIYSARARHLYIKQASMELCVPEDEVKKDLGRLLLQLESLQDKKLQEKYEQPNNQVSLNEAERRAALGLLNDPNLLSRVLTDFEACGVIGEESNKLVGYLAAVSRKLDKPLAVMIQSSSAAGKSSLMDAVLNMIPTEERIQFSAMTGQSLFYMGETNLKNKILAISEEEGADQASYALKLLQSEGEVSIASTGKNPVTGNLETQQYKVEGPVMLMMTTTAIDIDEELMNRCLVLSVNETREQTEAIHQMQRKRQTLEGLLAEHSKKDLITLHQNAQRLLRPLLVANPYAEQLTFLSDKTRTRRDHMKYLTLIRAIALLHQYQREVKRVEHNGQLLEYIEVTQDDIKVANQLAHEVLGRTLDELPPQTRKLLQLIHQMVTDACKAGKVTQSDYRFTRKDVRNYSGWGNTQLKVHLKRLEEMEYLLIHRGSRGQSFIYELLYSGEGEDGERFLQGLLDLENGYQYQCDDNKSGVVAQQSVASHTQVGTGSAGGHMPESQIEQHMASLLIEDEGKNNTRPNGQIMSYPHSLAASV